MCTFSRGGGGGGTKRRPTPTPSNKSLTGSPHRPGGAGVGAPSHLWDGEEREGVCVPGRWEVRRWACACVSARGCFPLGQLSWQPGCRQERSSVCARHPWGRERVVGGVRGEGRQRGATPCSCFFGGVRGVEAGREAGRGEGGIAPPSALSLSLVRLLTRPRASASLSGGNGPSPHPPPWWHAHRAARVRASCPDRRAGRVTATWHENWRLSSSSSRSAHTASPSCSPWAPPCPSSRTRCCR